MPPEKALDGLRWVRLSMYLSALICSAAALWNAYSVHQAREKPVATIVLHPPITTLGDENGFNYAAAPWVSGDRYMTVSEALKMPEAQGMTEEMFRDLLTVGRVVGTGSDAVKSMHGFYNDWILPRGFKIVPPGTKLPAAGRLKIPANP